MIKYKPIPLKFVPKFQRGGIWVDNMYGKFADSNISNVLIRPHDVGYQQHLEGIKLRQSFRAENFQREQFDYKKEQDAILNEYRQKELERSQEALELNKAITMADNASKFKDTLTGLDITPADQGMFNSIITEYNADPYNYDLTTVEGITSAHSATNKVTRDPRVRAMIEKSKLANQSKTILESYGENLAEIQTDPDKIPFYEDRTQQYKEITKRLADAMTNPNSKEDIAQIYEEASGLDFELNEVGKASVQLKQDKAKVDVATGEIENKLNQVKVDYITKRIEVLDKKREAGEISEEQYIKELSGVAGEKGAESEPAEVAIIKELMKGHPDIFPNTAAGRVKATSAAIRLAKGDDYNEVLYGKEEDADASVTPYSNLFVDKTNGRLNTKKSKITIGGQETYLDKGALSYVASNLKEVKDQKWGWGETKYAGEKPIVTYNDFLGDYGAISTNNLSLFEEALARAGADLSTKEAAEIWDSILTGGEVPEDLKQYGFRVVMEKDPDDNKNEIPLMSIPVEFFSSPMGNDGYGAVQQGAVEPHNAYTIPVEDNQGRTTNANIIDPSIYSNKAYHRTIKEKIFENPVHFSSEDLDRIVINGDVKRAWLGDGDSKKMVTAPTRQVTKYLQGVLGESLSVVGVEKDNTVLIRNSEFIWNKLAPMLTEVKGSYYLLNESGHAYTKIRLTPVETDGKKSLRLEVLNMM